MKTLPVVLIVTLLAGGCSTFRAPVQPPVGALFTNYKAPLIVNADGNVLGPKKGTAKVRYLYAYLFPVDIAWGEAGLREAARDGDITTVRAADYEYLSVLGLYQEFTVYVYGE